MFGWIKAKTRDVIDPHGKELVKTSRINSGNSLKIIKKLVENKADVNHIDAKSNTALFELSKGKDYASVLYLLDNKANVNYKNSYGNTALQTAVL